MIKQRHMQKLRKSLFNNFLQIEIYIIFRRKFYRVALIYIKNKITYFNANIAFIFKSIFRTTLVLYVIAYIYHVYVVYNNT